MILFTRCGVLVTALLFVGMFSGCHSPERVGLRHFATVQHFKTAESAADAHDRMNSVELVKVINETLEDFIAPQRWHSVTLAHAPSYEISKTHFVNRKMIEDEFEYSDPGSVAVCYYPVLPKKNAKAETKSLPKSLKIGFFIEVLVTDPEHANRQTQRLGIKLRERLANYCFQNK